MYLASLPAPLSMATLKPFLVRAVTAAGARATLQKCIPQVFLLHHLKPWVHHMVYIVIVLVSKVVWALQPAWQNNLHFRSYFSLSSWTYLLSFCHISLGTPMVIFLYGMPGIGSAGLAASSSLECVRSPRTELSSRPRPLVTPTSRDVKDNRNANAIPTKRRVT